MTFDFDHTKTETQNFQAALDEIARLQLRDAAMQAQIVADVGQQAEQAVSLDAAESLIRKNTEMINGQAKRIAELNTEAQELHDRKEEFAEKIAEQAKQIATLTAALVKERMKYDLLFPEMWSAEDKKYAAKIAYKQLAQELPDIFGGKE